MNRGTTGDKVVGGPLGPSTSSSVWTSSLSPGASSPGCCLRRLCVAMAANCAHSTVGLITCRSVAQLFELESGCQVYTSRFVRFILCGPAQSSSKHKKQQKKVRPMPEERLDRGHRSDWFVCSLVCPLLSADQPKPQENNIYESNKLKKLVALVCFWFFCAYFPGLGVWNHIFCLLS